MAEGCQLLEECMNEYELCSYVTGGDIWSSNIPMDCIHCSSCLRVPDAAVLPE